MNVRYGNRGEFLVLTITRRKGVEESLLNPESRALLVAAPEGRVTRFQTSDLLIVLYHANKSFPLLVDQCAFDLYHLVQHL